MARSIRTHLPSDSGTPGTLIPKHMTKQEFGKRLYSLMLAKSWNQSELGRQSGLPRDSISTYVRGRSLPTPQNLEALAKAFGVESTELLPNYMEAALDADIPSLEMKSGDHGMSWLRVNRLVSTATAIKIVELLENDRVLDRSGGSDAA